MKKISLFIFCFVLIYINIFSNNSVKAGEADRIVATYAPLGSPGLVIAVSKNNRIVYQKAQGMADIERDVPLSLNSVFHLASCGKQFTAMAILLLEEKGKIDLEDDICSYIPEFPHYGKKITIRHLMNHTSGIRDYAMLLLFSGRRWINFYPVKEILDLIVAQKKLNNLPGDEFIYSNSNYFLLGLIIEITSGISQKEFLDKNIFKPLKMEKTLFVANIYELIANRALGYSPGTATGFVPEISLMVNAGDGSIFSCVGDLIKWQNNFEHNQLGRKTRLLIEKMTKKGVLNNGGKIPYASGLYTGKYKGLEMVSHGGGWAGYRSEMIRFPGAGLSIVCLANLGSINTYELSLKIADIYLNGKAIKAVDHLPVEEISPSKKPEVKKTEKNILEEYPGRYYSEELNKDYLIELSDGKLRVKISGLHFDLTLSPIAKDEFSTISPGFRFVRDGKGEVSGFLMGEDSTRNIEFRRIDLN